MNQKRTDTKDCNLISGKRIFKNEVWLDPDDDAYEILCYLREQHPKAFIQMAEGRFFWFEEEE